jgi:SAM-dependent methyltransferase
MKCPVCLSQKNSQYDQDKHRIYYLCEDCELIFVSRDKALPAIDEMKRYEAHQNTDHDPHYQAYLKQIVDSSLPHIKTKARGLDFGCGKTTLLSKIYNDVGLLVDSYDVFFHPSEEIWQNKYDFIILSEVIEHLAQPREVMEKLNNLLNPGGKFFIKTKFYPENAIDFANWFYKRDLTHIQFFNPTSMQQLARHLKASGPVQLNEQDLYLLSIG